MPRVGVDAGQPGDLTVDAGFFAGLADRGLGQRFAELDRAAGQRPVPIVGAADQQDLARVVATTVLAEGTMVVAAGASGSW